LLKITTGVPNTYPQIRAKAVLIIINYGNSKMWTSVRQYRRVNGVDTSLLSY